MSNNSRLNIRKSISSIRNRYENAGITQINLYKKKLEELAVNKDSWTKEQSQEYEDAFMTLITLQASLQGAFSMADTLLLELGFLDESDIAKSNTLDNNEKTLKDISGDTGTIKYTITSDNN